MSQELFMENMKLGTKLIGGFLLVTAILVVVGVLGYRSISSMESRTRDIIEAAPLVDAAMEMKLAVRADMQIIMELLEAGNQEELNDVWKEHQESVHNFDLYAIAILEGGDTPEGTIYAAKDKVLRGIVTEADRFHNSEFQPRIDRIRELMLEEFTLTKQLEEVMRKFEGAFEQVISTAEDFEIKVKERIDGEIEAGISAESIMRTENTWADMAMEIKTTIAMSRIAIEEYAQSLEVESLPEIEQEYRATIEEFDGWINALLNGANTEEGQIAAVHVPELREMALSLDKIHDEAFQVQASQFMAIQKKLTTIATEVRMADKEADQIGTKMMGIIGGVEEGSKKIIREASLTSQNTASEAKTTAIAGVVIGFIVSLLLGTITTRNLTRQIGGEPQEITEIANKVARCELDVQFQSTGTTTGIYASLQEMVEALRKKVTLSEEIARGNLAVDVPLASSGDTLGKAQQDMVNGLSETLSQVTNSADQMVNGANQVSQSSQIISQGSTEQSSALEQISSSMEQVSSQIQGNADNAGQASQLAVAASKQAEEGNEQMGQMLQSMKEINQASENISNIIKTIDEIAFQTNVLAINAAVEAARAGVHGKGFAVVAEEVRSLAGRSAEAAKETAQIIQDSVKKTETGAKMAEEMASSLQEIVNGSTKVLDLVNEISTASNEQARGVEEINRGIGQLNQTTQQSAQIAEETASASEEFTGQAESLKRLVSSFTLRQQSSFLQGTTTAAYQTPPAQIPNLPQQPATVAMDPVNPTPPSQEPASAPSGADLISFDEEDTGKF